MTNLKMGVQENSLHRQICDWKDDVWLTPWSGIQTLDFGLSEDDLSLRVKFIEHAGTYSSGSSERVLTRLTGDNEKDAEFRASLSAKDGIEYSIEGGRVAEVFEGVWLPAPMFRVRRETELDNGPILDRGPGSWARIRITRLEEKDPVSNHTHRVQIALDTSLDDAEQRQNDIYIKPSVNDAENGRVFKLGSDPDQIAWFLNDDEGQSWAGDWIEDIYKTHIVQTKGERGLKREDGRSFEDWACYLTLLEMVVSRCNVPGVRLTNTVTDKDGLKPVEVDLVLDIGNSRICGLLVERFEDEASVDLTRAFPLEVRDLDKPERHYTGLMDSRVEFSEVSFGDERFASRSGNRTGFLWPGLVRIGSEAQRLMVRSEGTESLSGLSSPKRYLWDQTQLPQDWRFHGHDAGRPLPRSVRAALQYLNQSGDVIEQVEEEEAHQLRTRGETDLERAVRPRFSRSACFGMLLSEIFAHALVQVNDPASRAGRRQSNLPRVLNRIILTIPTATTVQEQAIIKSRAAGALKLIWDMSEIPDTCATGRPPSLHVEWDEASCTQLVWLYNEIVSNFGGGIEGYLNVMGKKRQSPFEDDACPSIRVGCLDIGGGTTDLMVTTYFAEADRVLRPVQNFREGFRVAGDDLLKSVVSHIILPALEKSIAGSENGQVRETISALFGGDVGAQDQRAIQRRKHFSLRVLYPLAIKVLEQLETDDTNGVSIKTADILMEGEALNPAVTDYIETPMTQIGFEWSLLDLNETVRRDEADRVIKSLLQGVFSNLVEVIGGMDCDVVLMTGRPSKLRSVMSLMEETMVVAPHRLIRMDSYKPERWYPFRSPMTHTVGDPKSTVAVGAMLMSLAAARLPNFRVDTSAYKMKSTASFIGEMERNGQIKDDRVIFRSDSDSNTAEIKMYAPVHLGSRQVDLERWTVTPLYMIEFANPDEMASRLPAKVKLSRVEGITRDEAETVAQALRAEALREAFTITGVEDADGGGVTGDVVLRLNTMGFEKDYWLDSGAFDV